MAPKPFSVIVKVCQHGTDASSAFPRHLQSDVYDMEMFMLRLMCPDTFFYRINVYPKEHVKHVHDMPHVVQ